MKVFDASWDIPGATRAMKLRGGIVCDMAGRKPMKRSDISQCTGYHAPTGTLMVWTRDTGHHTSGWWKNPDYERCLHLSLSFRNPENSEEVLDHRHDLAARWVEEFFGSSRNLVWTEPPYFPQGKALDTWHYRVFFAPDWITPILPRGEVYSKQFTEAGWFSWSDRQAMVAQAEQREMERSEG
jgi:hypothetical protein